MLLRHHYVVVLCRERCTMAPRTTRVPFNTYVLMVAVHTVWEGARL